MKAEKRYFWLPIDTSAQRRWVDVFADGEKILDLELNIGNLPGDMYGVLDLEDYLQKNITFSNGLPEQWVDGILNEDFLPQVTCKQRPALHFTPQSGWMNDPNGLILVDGVYHFFFQYNPFDVQWGNMHWGHAVSRDLISWQQVKTALWPDRDGTMYSGCAVADKQGVAGQGKDAILFYYTATGGENPWSQGKDCTQKLALSKDGGQTLQKTGKTVVDCIAQGNRDPKVIHHEPTDSYVMVLYLKDNDFAILKSKNLLDWEETQRLTFENCWECPDFFELPIDGGPEKKWVFWCADGYYYTGDFDGSRFAPDGEEQKQAYVGKLAYAAQTFSNTPGRRISVPWLRTGNAGKPFTGMAGIPMELSLTRQTGKTLLRLNFVRELCNYRKRRIEMKHGYASHTENCPFEICICLPADNTGIMTMEFLGLQMQVNCSQGICQIGAQSFGFDKGKELDVRIVCDYGVVEATAAGGLIYIPIEHNWDTLCGDITVNTTNGFKMGSVDCRTLEK